MSGVNSTFLHTLTITGGDAEDYNGTFSCTVSNSRGPAPVQSLDIHSRVNLHNNMLAHGTVTKTFTMLKTLLEKIITSFRAYYHKLTPIGPAPPFRLHGGIAPIYNSTILMCAYWSIKICMAGQ